MRQRERKWERGVRQDQRVGAREGETGSVRQDERVFGEDLVFSPPARCCLGVP